MYICITENALLELKISIVVLIRAETEHRELVEFQVKKFIQNSSR